MNKFNSEFLDSNASDFYQVVSDWNDKQKKRLNTRDFQYYQTEVHKIVLEDLEQDFNSFIEKLKKDFKTRYLPKGKKQIEQGMIDVLISKLNLAKLTNGDVKQVLQAFADTYKETYYLHEVKNVVGDEYKPLFFDEDIANNTLNTYNKMVTVASDTTQLRADMVTIIGLLQDIKNLM